MTKKQKKQEGVNDPTDIRYYLHQPHDKYVRALLQHRTIALQIIRFVLPEKIKIHVDLDSLQLSNSSYINENLQLSLADICYEGFSYTELPFRICLLFEHKSEAPAQGIYEQLSRYINQVWQEDQKQDRPPTLSIPVLIYHGSTPVRKENPGTLFPKAPQSLLRFVPLFDYILLDIASMAEDHIVNHVPELLRNIFLALKYSRQEAYLRQNLKKVIIFAKRFHADENLQIIIQYTLLYMASVSKTTQQALENPATTLTVEEEELVLPYVFEKYRIKYKEEGLAEGRSEGRSEGMAEGRSEGMAEGIAQGLSEGLKQGIILTIHKFIQKNPSITDKEIAELFEVEQEIIQQARQQ